MRTINGGDMMLKPKFGIARYIKNANKGEVTGTITYRDGTKKEFLYGDLSFKNSEGIGLNKQGKEFLPIQQRELRVGDIVKIRDDIPLGTTIICPHEKTERVWNSDEESAKEEERTYHIQEIRHDGKFISFKEKMCMWWPPDWLELVDD